MGLWSANAPAPGDRVMAIQCEKLLANTVIEDYSIDLAD
mgnify:CR=1 FL=1